MKNTSPSHHNIGNRLTYLALATTVALGGCSISGSGEHLETQPSSESTATMTIEYGENLWPELTKLLESIGIEESTQRGAILNFITKHWGSTEGDNFSVWIEENNGEKILYFERKRPIHDNPELVAYNLDTNIPTIDPANPNNTNSSDVVNIDS